MLIGKPTRKLLKTSCREVLRIWFGEDGKGAEKRGRKAVIIDRLSKMWLVFLVKKKTKTKKTNARWGFLSLEIKNSELHPAPAC